MSAKIIGCLGMPVNVPVTPPLRHWVSLTDEEIAACGWCDLKFARAIEAKLKEKNT